MKKFRIILAVLLVFAVTCAVVAGCGDPAPDDVTPVTYTVTVTGGTADKTTAEEGQTITLTQGTAPDGSEFLRWTVNGKDITGNTFTMPAQNTTVTAVFGKIDYTVTVTGGTADKATAQIGDTVTLTQGTAPSGKKFNHWTVNGVAIEGNSFVMTAAAATVVAVYDNVYSVTVTGGTASSTLAEEGDEITLTPGAAEAGYDFSHWTVNGERITGNKFTMTAENTTVVAVFVKKNYTVSVTGCTADKTTAQIGDTVTLTASSAPEGKKFDHFTVNGAKITGNTFTMTAANATVVAVFVDIDYTVTLTGCTADKTTAHKGDTVTLTANAAPAGKKFDHFTVNGAKITGNTFTMTAENATVVAVFVDIVYTVNVTGGSADKATAKLGDTVTLTADEETETKKFAYWTVNGTRIDGNSFELSADTANGEIVTVVGKYVDLVQKIATPNNSASELIFPEEATFPCAVAIDRADNKTNTMFTVGTDYVLFYIYDSTDADTSKPLGALKMTANPVTAEVQSPGGVLSTSDGTKTMNIKGQPFNYYIDWMDWNSLFGLIKHELGYNFGEGRMYYFAAKSVAKTEPISVEGFDVTFQDSDVSVIGSKGIAKDASKPDGIYTVTVTGGFINGDLTSIESGYGNTVTLSTTLREGYVFNGWYLVGENGEKTGEALSYDLDLTYTVTMTATLTAEFLDRGEVELIPLATPNNEGGALIGRAGNGAIELDRYRTGEGAGQTRHTMFTAGVSSVVYYIYNAADADTADYVGRFRLRVIPGADAASGTAMVGWVETIDGTVSKKIVRGTAGDYYIDGSNANEYYDLLKTILGYNYSAGQTYYYAAQCVAAENTVYTDSEISLIGANGFAQNADVPSGLFDITVLDGKIDGTETTVKAGYGVKLTLTAEMPEGMDTFLGWKKVTYDENNNEVLGDVASFDLTYTLSVSGAVTLRPTFANSGEIAAEKLAAPDNSTNQMILFRGALIEYDRQKDADGKAMTAFALGVDHIVYYIYESNADDAQPIASFKLMKDGEKGYFLAENGTRFDILGEPGNYYTTTGNAHNFIKNTVVGNWDDNNTYYFACQAISADRLLYEDSDIGAKGQAWGAI